MKLRTLSDCVGGIGNQILEELEEITGRILKMYRLDTKTKLPMEGVCLTPSTKVSIIPKKTRVEMLYQNRYENSWFCYKLISFIIPKKKQIHRIYVPDFVVLL